MASVTVDTQGEEYPEPEKIEKQEFATGRIDAPKGRSYPVFVTLSHEG